MQNSKNIPARALHNLSEFVERVRFRKVALSEAKKISQGENR